jgi:hypothetical protein
MDMERLENNDAKKGSDLERLDYWKKMADVFAETETALKLEKTKVLDQKRIEWWKKEAKKGLRH